MVQKRKCRWYEYGDLYGSYASLEKNRRERGGAGGMNIRESCENEVNLVTAWISIKG